MKKIFTFFLLLFPAAYAFSQWSTDPALNNQVGGIPADDVIPKVASASNGNTYISWFSFEGGNYNVRLQQYDPAGNELFAPGGMLVSDHPSMSWLTDYNLSVDKENCAIVGFQDIRNGNNNIHVYKIGPSGQFFWGPDGLSLSNSTAFEPYPVIQNLTDNSTVFAWQSEDASGQGIIRLQKISGDSTRMWGQWGIVYSSTNPQERYIYPSLVPSDNNSVILIFHKQTGTFTAPKYLYAQKFDAAGMPVWPQDVAIYNGPGVPIIPAITVESDSANGAVICWHDTRQGMGMFNVYVQRIDQAGNLLFTAGGQVVTTAPGYIQMNPSMTYVPSTQTVYTFFNVENTGQSQWGLAGQKMDATGQLLWGNNMLTILPVSSMQIGSIRARRSTDQVLVTYTFYSSGGFADAEIMATMLDATGQPVWVPGISSVCTVQSEKGHQVTSYYAAHQWVLAWEDNRNGTADIYAQNILINGELGPYTTGINTIGKKQTAGLAVYPNPVDDIMNISISGNAGEIVEVEILSVLGQQADEVFAGQLPSDNTVLQVNRGDLKPGVYFVRLSGSSVVTQAVVVK
ncbi:MAG: T9SS type A sorting domain-containing protein [Bacteroidales bacterium]